MGTIFVEKNYKIKNVPPPDIKGVFIWRRASLGTRADSLMLQCNL